MSSHNSLPYTLSLSFGSKLHRGDTHLWAMNQHVLSKTKVQPVLLATSTSSVKLSCKTRRFHSLKKLPRQPSTTGHTGILKVACAMRKLPEGTNHRTERLTHLVVMANGLFGTSSNWDVIIEELQQSSLDLSHTLLVASNANSLTQVQTVWIHVVCSTAWSSPQSAVACIFRLTMASIPVVIDWPWRSRTRLRGTLPCSTSLCLATLWVDCWCAMLQVAVIPKFCSLLTSNASAVEQLVNCTPVSFACSILIEGNMSWKST